MSELGARLHNVVTASLGFWGTLVWYAVDCDESELPKISVETGQSLAGLRRKVAAIKYCKWNGMENTDIVKFGPERTLSMYQVYRKEFTEPRKNITLGIRASQKELLDTQIERVKMLLRSKDNPATSESFGDWLASYLEQMSDAQILAHANGQS